MENTKQKINKHQSCLHNNNNNNKSYITYDYTVVYHKCEGYEEPCLFRFLSSTKRLFFFKWPNSVEGNCAILWQPAGSCCLMSKHLTSNSLFIGCPTLCIGRLPSCCSGDRLFDRAAPSLPFLFLFFLFLSFLPPFLYSILNYVLQRCLSVK